MNIGTGVRLPWSKEHLGLSVAGRGFGGSRTLPTLYSTLWYSPRKRVCSKTGIKPSLSAEQARPHRALEILLTVLLLRTLGSQIFVLNQCGNNDQVLCERIRLLYGHLSFFVDELKEARMTVNQHSKSLLLCWWYSDERSCLPNHWYFKWPPNHSFLSHYPRF